MTALGPIAARELSPTVVSGGQLFIAVCGLPRAVASLVAEHGLQELWHIGFVAPRHVRSSRTRD